MPISISSPDLSLLILNLLCIFYLTKGKEKTISGLSFHPQVITHPWNLAVCSGTSILVEWKSNPMTPGSGNCHRLWMSDCNQRFSEWYCGLLSFLPSILSWRMRKLRGQCVALPFLSFILMKTLFFLPSSLSSVLILEA